MRAKFLVISVTAGVSACSADDAARTPVDSAGFSGSGPNGESGQVEDSGDGHGTTEQSGNSTNASGSVDDGSSDGGGSSSGGGDSTDPADGGRPGESGSGTAGDADGTSGDGSTGDSPDPARCGPTELIGWAAENGGTTGGAGGPTTMVDDPEELVALAASDGPQIIVVEGDITLDVRLEVTSDKTIEGAAGGATIHGSIVLHGHEDSPVENVIIRNLFVDGASGAIDDAVSLQWATNVWFDHCDIFDGADGNLDITHGSDFLTVSWTRFHYTDDAPDMDHRFSSLIGHSDNNADEDEGRLRVTMHHNWWADGVVERMPRVRFGRVHVLNNLFDSSDTNYAVRAALGSEVLVEANYFDGVSNPHEIYDDNAELVAVDNVYAATSGAQDQAGDAFVPPYSYGADDAETILLAVPDCVGPR